MKILNLYAGIGGNRKLWVKPYINENIEVTAVDTCYFSVGDMKYTCKIIPQK
jgi:hypothetical protein